MTLRLLSPLPALCLTLVACAQLAQQPAPSAQERAPSHPPPSAPFDAQTRKLSEVPDDVEVAKSEFDGSPLVATSQGVQHLATIVENIAGEEAVLIDGTMGEFTDDVWQVEFSPTGESVAYAAKDGGRVFLILNGKQGPSYDDIQWATSLFSADGSTIAYATRRGDEMFVVVGEREGKSYDAVLPPVLSPDGQTVAYPAQDGGQEFIVVDDREMTRYEQAFDVKFNPDGSTFTYIAGRGERELVVVGEAEGKTYDAILSDPTFSADGRTVAYVAEEGGQQFVVMGQEEGKRYDEVFGWSLVFRPGSATVAYAARRGGEEFAVVGTQEHPRYQSVKRVVFSPDGEHTAYFAGEGNDNFLVLDGVQSERGYEALFGDDQYFPAPLFSADSQAVAYVGLQGEHSLAVVGGQEGKPYGAVWGLVFSPKGSAAAYAASSEPGSAFVVVGDREGKVYNEVWPPMFSPDGEYVLYLAREGREFWRVVERIAD